MPQAGLSADAAPPKPAGRTRLGPFALAAAALAVVLGVLLSDSLFGGKVLSQADALFQFQPWKEIADGRPPGNEVLLDQSIVMQPWAWFCAQEVQRGEWPLWNPNNYCGQPMVGTYQSAIYWPLNWIYFLFPTWSFLAWSAFARLLAAGLFTWLFLRRLAVEPGPALVGALGFSLSGFMIAWLGHLHTHVALFLPAMLWAIERTAARPRWREATLFGLFVGLNLVAGHVQTSVHVLLAVAGYGLYRLRAEVDGARLSAAGLARLGVCAALGLLLAMPQLLPFLEYLRDSRGAVVLETFDQVSREGVKPAAILMVDPDHYGSPHTNDYTGPRGHNLNYNELIGGYVGRALLVLALLALVFLPAARRSGRARAAPFFVGLVVLAGLVAWQVFPFYELARAVPKLRSTKLMRVFVLVAFGLSVLGALGLSGLLARLRLSGARAHLLTAAVFALVAVELLGFARGYNPAVEPARVYPPTPVTDFLAEQPGLWRALGVQNTILMPSANLVYGVPMVSGYDSIEFATMTDLVARMSSHAGGELFIKEIPYFDRGLGIADLLGVRYLLSEDALPAPYELVRDGEVKIYANPGAMPRAFLARAVRVVPDAAERLDVLGADGFDPTLALVESPPPAGFEAATSAGATDPGAVEVVRYEARELELRADVRRPALLVLTDVFAPGWIAEVDGEARPIERVDHTLRGLWLEPGPRTITMRYAPRSTTIGVGLALVALVALAGLALWGRGTRVGHP